MKKIYSLKDNVFDWTGALDYTFEDGLLSGKGKLVKKNNLDTNFKNTYYYVSGFLMYRVNGKEAKKFARENNLVIIEE